MSVLEKPLVDLYTDYLISSFGPTYLISSFGPTTATGLSRLLGAGLSHDKITRFLSARTFTSAHLWQIVKPLVRKVQNDNAVLVVDDSIVHKPHTDASELIGWHYDHTTGTSVKGINFLTTLYCTQATALKTFVCLSLLPWSKRTKSLLTKRQANSNGGPASARTNITAICSKRASRTKCLFAMFSTMSGLQRQTI